MGAIAGALAREGWKVSGCDEKPRPPMSRYLEDIGIPIAVPCRAEDLPPPGTEIVVGKRIPADHPVLAALRSRGQPWASFPSFLARHFLSRSRNAVVAGGVGKSTTTSLLARILRHAGHDPDYLIGARPRGFPAPAKLAGARECVIEGDEYASCDDDPRPKFLHYHPEVVIITNLLEDHPDLYEGIEPLARAFRDLVALLPTRGLLVLPDDDGEALALARHAVCPVATVGYGDSADFRISEGEMGPDGSRFLVGETPVALPMCGRMNVRNAAMAMVAAGHFGIGPAAAAAALSGFAGVARRQEECTLGGVHLVTDKATHPVAVGALFDAVRQRFPGRRLVSVLQPRATGGRNWIYQTSFPGVLATADLAVLLPAHEHQPQPGRQWPGGPFDLGALAQAARAAGTRVELARRPADAAALLRRVIEPGDVVVVTLPEQEGALEEAIGDALRRSVGGL